MLVPGVLPVLAETLQAQRPVVCCRLIAVQGSTPQKPGAAMLVFADGQQAGTLGGGCVEADVRRAALRAHAEGCGRIVTLALDHDGAWDDGLLCGGRVTVLLQPIAPASPAARYYRHVCQIQQQGQGTEIVVIDGRQTGLSEAECFLCDADGALVDCLAATPLLPAVVPRHLQPLAARPAPYVAAGLAFLPWLQRCRLLLVGGGHVAQAVADLAGPLDFDVWVVDDRADFVTADRFPGAAQRVAGEFDDVLPALDITAQTYCVIVTRGHRYDARALYHLVRRPACYVGMIGSRRKIRLIFDELLEAGVPAHLLQRVYAPLGIDIGSRTLSEIAVSICAELVAHRNLQGRVPGRPAGVCVAPE